MPEMFNSSDSLRALLQYHVLLGTHPSQSFSNSSKLVPTLLQNRTYCNVTGGQRVELLRKDGQPVVLSAIKAQSGLSHPDVFFKGGLIHVIDNMLTIPVGFPQTITKAKLTNLVALLNKGNWLNPNSVAFKLTLEVPDLTIFAPDNPAYGADFHGWDGLSQYELDNIFLYHVIPQVLYSTNFTNGTAYPTSARLAVTAREYSTSNSSAIFIDQSQITRSNYLTANGVFQIIDRPLNLNTSSLAPTQKDINNALGIIGGSENRSLTTAAIVGIVIGAIAVLLAVSIVLGLRWKMRKQTNSQREISSISYHQPPPDYKASQYELEQNAIISPSRQYPSQFSELESPKVMSAHVSEMDATELRRSRQASQFGGSDRGPYRPPRTPPELDGREWTNSTPTSVSVSEPQKTYWV